MLNPPVDRYVDGLLYQIQKRQALPQLFIESVQSLHEDWHPTELAEMFAELLDYETIRQAIREQMINNLERRLPDLAEEEELHWHG